MTQRRGRRARRFSALIVCFKPTPRPTREELPGSSGRDSETAPLEDDRLVHGKTGRRTQRPSFSRTATRIKLTPCPTQSN